MEDYIFVYGTLRKGGVRELPRLFSSARDLGRATIRGRIRVFGAYPGLRLDEEGLVIGEVYSADAAALAVLDDIERFFPGDEETCYYFRRRVTATLANGTPVDCWTYEFNPKYYGERNAIASGDWIAHAAAKGLFPEERWPDWRGIGGRAR